MNFDGENMMTSEDMTMQKKNSEHNLRNIGLHHVHEELPFY